MKRMIIKWILFWTDLIKRENYLLKRMNETICCVHLSLSSISFWKWWFMTNSNSNHSNITWWWMWFEKHQHNQIQNNKGDFISMCINQFFYWGCVKTIVNRMVTESNEKNKNKENVFLFWRVKRWEKKRTWGSFPFVKMGFGWWWSVWYLKCDRIINHHFWFVYDKLFE